MSWRNNSMLAASIGIIYACAPAGTGEPMQDMAADQAAVSAASSHESASLSSGNVDSVLANYTDDVDMMPPNAPAVRGSAALREMVTAMLAEGAVSGSYSSSTVEVSGDIAVERYAGTLTTTPKAGGSPVAESIKGVHIYRRQADGSWKIAADVWNTDAPPPAPPK